MRDDDCETMTTNTIIPAPPGWYLCILLEGDEDHADALYDEPIVAWDVRRKEFIDRQEPLGYRVVRSTTPVTLDGTDVDGITGFWVIRDPAGKYREYDGPTFDSAEDALKHLVAQAKEWRKPAAKLSTVGRTRPIPPPRWTKNGPHAAIGPSRPTRPSWPNRSSTRNERQAARKASPVLVPFWWEYRGQIGTSAFTGDQKTSATLAPVSIGGADLVPPMQGPSGPPDLVPPDRSCSARSLASHKDRTRAGRGVTASGTPT